MKVLIANRGEIALRIIRACRKMGLSPIAVYSEADKNGLHVRQADEAYLLGPAPATESYLHQEKILAVAKKAKAKLIHPGYGFLSENASFVKACEKGGFIFVGPSSKTISLLGDKLKARALAKTCGIPTIEGVEKEVKGVKEFKALAKKIKLPFMIKAVGGGGGKGIRVVRKASEAQSAFELATSEAKTAFKNPKIYIEQYLEGARHIEIQMVADQKGNVVSLGERECSIQRRFQKLIEETPSPFVTPPLRHKMEEAAKKIFLASHYTNAGTVEFLVDPKQHFYFLEVNTRLQVEHPITEMVLGVDLVCEQFRVALGERLSLKQEDLSSNGHAIEARIYAEDPENNFFPSSGKIDYLDLPRGENIRLESALYPGIEISLYYDPLIAKLIAWGQTREEAIQRLDLALQEMIVSGVKTTIPFFREILQTPAFRKGNINTQFLDQWLEAKQPAIKDPEFKAALAALLYHLIKEKEEMTSFKDFGKKLSPWQQTIPLRGTQKGKNELTV